MKARLRITGLCALLALTLPITLALALPPAAIGADAVTGRGAMPAAMAATGTVQVVFPPWDNAERLVTEALDAARRQVLVQAFAFTNRAIASALIAARRRGVDVRITADRGQTFSGDNSRIPELAAAGIPVLLEVRYAAAHNKTMVIDAGTADAAVITGSFNWTWGAQHRNAENLLILRGNPDLVRAYRDNWQRHAADALPYAADLRHAPLR